MDPYTATMNAIAEGFKAFQLVYNDIPAADRQKGWDNFFAWADEVKADFEAFQARIDALKGGK